MDETNKGTEVDAPKIPPEEKVTVSTDDMEARIAALEAEKAKLIESNANYKVAYLKEHKKNEDSGNDESPEDKMRRIAKETLADSRLAEIAEEQDAIIQKALKENKELKLAHLNKTGDLNSKTASTEVASVVKDTIITPEQLAAFKAKGWTDKDIERYKKNLIKYGGR